MKSIKQFNPLDAEFLQRCFSNTAFSSTMTNFTSLPKCSLLLGDASAGAKTKAQFHQMTLALLKERLLKCLVVDLCLHSSWQDIQSWTKGTRTVINSAWTDLLLPLEQNFNQR